MPPLMLMRSAGGRWRVKEFVQRGRSMFLILERQQDHPNSTVTLGRIVADLDQVAAVLGDDFDQLEDDPAILAVGGADF